jgi:hypothetical protein
MWRTWFGPVSGAARTCPAKRTAIAASEAVVRENMVQIEVSVYGGFQVAGMDKKHWVEGGLQGTAWLKDVSTGSKAATTTCSQECG